MDPQTALAMTDLEEHRRALVGHCARILGSAFDADDAVQQTMVRAWTSMGTFEGRSSVRSWLYRIATNVCLDELRSRRRRPEPVPDPAGEAASSAGHDPAEVAASREAVRLAFVVALERLPRSQRTVLVLREVLAWPAAEVAELLGTSVAAVNSALQRARATLAARPPAASRLDPGRLDPGREAQLAAYLGAFERYDTAALVGLLQQEWPPDDQRLVSARSRCRPAPGSARPRRPGTGGARPGSGWT